MKTPLIFCIVCFTLVAGDCSAKIWRINNVAGVTADFTTPQLANNSSLVQSGDTLHIEPSTISYGTLSLTKRLTILSIGDFFAANPAVQYSPTDATLVSIAVSDVNASGSVIQCNTSSGISLNGVSNVRVERCHIEGALLITNSSSIIVLHNFIYSCSLTGTVTSILISNNIIEGGLDMNSLCSATITNNVLQAMYAGVWNTQIYNASFQNNIINRTGLSITFFASVVQNNLASNTTLPAGSGNQNGVVMTNVFANPLGTDDVSFQLKSGGGNPAVGAGIAGVDCGAFGGSAPFKLGLQPAIPAIYKILAPVTPSGNTMNVTFSTRSNN